MILFSVAISGLIACISPVGTPLVAYTGIQFSFARRKMARFSYVSSHTPRSVSSIPISDRSGLMFSGALISIIGSSATGLPKTSSVSSSLEVEEEEEGSELVTFNQRPFNV